MTEESKGFYKAAFVVKHTGVYEVMVSAEGQPIKGVPFKCEVHPGKPDFTKCKLGGQGLQAVRLGQPCDVLIELYDVYSNRLTSALDALSDIQVRCRSRLPAVAIREGSMAMSQVLKRPALCANAGDRNPLLLLPCRGAGDGHGTTDCAMPNRCNRATGSYAGTPPTPHVSGA